MQHNWVNGTQDADILVKFVKVDGRTIENPVPRFEYGLKVGTWRLVIDAERHARFFDERDQREVEVEVGTHFGTLRDVGRVTTWRGELAEGPAFVANIVGSDPMDFVERA